jgi:hypothetical protein
MALPSLPWRGLKALPRSAEYLAQIYYLRFVRRLAEEGYPSP